MNTIAIFKIIFRGWWRNKLFILISLISLTVGLGCTNLLVTFFIHEYNIEQQTPDRHLIFALRQDSPMEEGVKVSYVNANTAEQIKGKYAEITDMLRLNGMYADICKYNGIKYEHPLFICADSTLNKFFHYTTLEGSLSTVLTTPDKIAISETFARKLFHGHSGIGEMIEIIDADGKTQKYEVGAILKERPQSFLHFDLLTGITGEFWGGPTLLKLHPGASASLLQEKIRKDKIPTLTPGSTQYYVDALKNLYFNNVSSG